MFENNGTSALKPYEEYELPAQKKKKVKHGSAKKTKKGLSAQSKASIVAAVVAVFAMAAVILMFKAVLNTEYKALSKQKAELERVSSRVERLSSEIEGSSVVAIEEKAAEMGLMEADKSQIVYISLNSVDSGEVLAEDSANHGLNLFFNKIAAIAEYLY